MRATRNSAARLLLLAALWADLMYAWMRLIYDDVFVVLESVGLWIPMGWAFLLIVVKSVGVLLFTFHPSARLSFGAVFLDALTGAVVALWDVSKALTADCDCFPSGEVPWSKLAVKAGLLALLGIAWAANRRKSR